MLPPGTKEITLGSTLVLVGLALFLSFMAAASTNFTNVGLDIVVGLAALGWIAIAAIFLALSSVPWLSRSVVAATSLIIILAGSFRLGAIVAALLVAVLMLRSQYILKRNLSDRLRYHPFTAFYAGIRVLVYGILVAAIGISLPNLTNLVESQGFRINSHTASVLIEPFSAYLGGELPGLAEGGNVDDFIDQIVASELPAGVELTPLQRQQYREEISRRFKQPITGQETLGDLVAARMNNWLNQLVQSNSLTVIIAIIVAALLAMRAVVPVLAFVALALVASSVAVGRSAGFLQLTEQNRPVQQLELT